MSEAIKTLIGQLEFPDDYFSGFGEYTISLPSEIILFYRNNFGKDEKRGDLSLISNDVHYRHVLVINLGDPVRMLVDGDSIELKADSFMLLLPYQYHRYINKSQNNIYLLFLTFELEDNLFFEQFRNMIFQYDKKSNRKLEILIGYYNNKNELLLPYYSGYFLLSILSEPIPISTRSEKSKNSGIINEICHTIYRNKKIRIKELCRKMNLSDRYLRRIFKKVMNITLGQYILEIRMFEAMKLLTITDMSIGEISDKTGYDSIYSFSRSFKKSIGLPPKEYRKRARHRNRKSRKPANIRSIAELL